MRRWIAAAALLAALCAEGCGHDTAAAGSASSNTGDTRVVARDSSLSREKRKREDSAPDTVAPSQQDAKSSGGNLPGGDSSSY